MICPCCIESVDSAVKHYFEAIKGPTKVSNLPDKVQKLITGPNGNRWKESESVSVGTKGIIRERGSRSGEIDERTHAY
eukprot:2955376-Amphidinium_carterae.1